MLGSSLALLALAGGAAADALQPRWGYGWNTTTYETPILPLYLPLEVNSLLGQTRPMRLTTNMRTMARS